MFKFKLSAVFLLMLGAFVLTGCSDDGDSGGGDAIVSISAIPGVTIPVRGEVPVTTITSTDQYTVTVSWSPSDATFASTTVYTATITLTAKPGYTLNGVASNFFTVAGTSTAATNSADSGVVTAVFPATLAESYNLRDTGPAGGLIFYIADNSDGTYTYYEAAPNTWNGGTADPNIEWASPNGLIGAAAQGQAIGTGKTNTTAIVNWLNTNGQSGRAAQVVDSLNFGGYSDWFLPSKDELNAMNVNLRDMGVGGFATAAGAAGYYWSSSENNADLTWMQSFNTGQQGSNSKAADSRVRAVRAFIN